MNEALASSKENEKLATNNRGVTHSPSRPHSESFASSVMQILHRQSNSSKPVLYMISVNVLNAAKGVSSFSSESPLYRATH